VPALAQLLPIGKDVVDDRVVLILGQGLEGLLQVIDQAQIVHLLLSIRGKANPEESSKVGAEIDI
jgi:hypothetical protein